ncbi:hypothetical protein M9H77_16451 [Catharanthus roseus]|uniref:Uncharacterized protein n=1 Tax=Catharanthus roseus TaxID=4058 RepID=A0ACC0B1T3_CATRO|nr:hypothetical protein M9H77_16451 [Catharanthus roseus]
MDPNLWIVRITMRVPSYYEVMNNDEEMCYLWTIPPHHAKEGIHILVEFEHDRNKTNMTEHITATTVNNDDNEVDESDRDDAVSSQSKSDDDNDPEEGELQTP